MTRFLLLILCWLIVIVRGPAAAAVQVLAATNFEPCLLRLADDYTNTTGAAIVVRTGSTGLLCAQLIAGAPGDIFFAADSLRPRLLEADSLTVLGSRATYAIGRLVLWYPGNTTDSLSAALDQARGEHLAISNPLHAPYGVAAVQALHSLQRWDQWQPALVRGADVGQTWQFIHSGAATLGFVSLAQVRSASQQGAAFPPGEILLVPASLHASISQQAVLMRQAPPEAAAFLAYVNSVISWPTLRDFGYEVPPS